ncbi:MAG: DNA/RNA-binding protein AlbA [Nitrososphaerota archaeon]|nr:DNA/RNA-binding protein AlbA [Nitrososphaerota archaeon]
MEGNTVIVGRKSAIRYVTAIVTIFNSGSSEVRLRARGRHISRSVDVVNLLRGAFLSDVRVKEMRIGTDMLMREGRTRPVSFIEIVLSRG